MSRFIETIKLLDGELKNLKYHQARLERTRRSELGLRHHPRLEEVIRVPEGLDRGLFKCRVLYRKEVELIEYEPAQPLRVERLKLVYADSISYGCKYEDRSSLKKLFELREGCDEILIVKDGCITDSYVANVAFREGSTWVTPDTPLLAGTMRASLLDSGDLQLRRIRPVDLKSYQELKLINALNDLAGSCSIGMENIVY